MANLVGKSPWLIDTPSATVLTETPVTIRELRFVNYAGPTDFVEVQDASGHFLVRLQAHTDGAPDISTAVNFARGLKVPLLDSNGAANMANGKPRRDFTFLLGKLCNISKKNILMSFKRYALRSV